MVRYEMLPNIIAHSRQVMRVALAITDNLKNGTAVNREIIQAAALLHDITKTRSLQTKEPHDQSGAQLLRELGFARLGDIVEQHVILKTFDPVEKLEEREIINYADKRVMHDQVVSLSERVEDLIKRYGLTDEIIVLIRRNESQAFEVERKIARCMAIDLDTAIRAI
ncbi:MAG: HDIG domain-containing protein [Smithellaceae bacterium]|nr:HDIG domain-containing protein [Smithellaceae bacterium]